MKTKPAKTLMEQMNSVRVITSSDGYAYILADKMYSTVEGVEPHKPTGTSFRFFTLREPSLTRAVIRRLLSTTGTGHTLRYSTNHYDVIRLDGTRIETLDIGCKRFQGAALVALKRWAHV